jgi:hypothetical protein
MVTWLNYKFSDIKLCSLFSRAGIFTSDSVKEPTSENNLSGLVPKKVSDKYKPILPAPPLVPNAQQPQLMLAGTLHNYKNMTPVYLVLTSAGDDQSKS